MSNKDVRGHARRTSLTRALAVAALTTGSALVAIPPVAEAQVSARFSRIDVAGNKRIEADTVRSIAGLPTGRAVAPAEINAALQALYNSGLFSEIELVPNAGRLTIHVVESARISRIAFEGNRRLDDKMLSSVILLRPRQAYTEAAAEADALRIVEAYQASGRYSAQVRPVIIRRADNRVDLAFEITEGDMTDVQRISFVGNKAFSDRRLRRAIATGEAGLLSILMSNDNYKRERIAYDQEKLRDFYQDRGYLDFAIRSVVSELSRERDAFYISFNIFEGPQYRLGKVGVSSSVRGIAPEAYRSAVDVRSGDVFSRSETRDIVERISLMLGENGFPFADVEPRLTPNPQTLTVDVDFEIVPTPKRFVERIDIEGNSRTLDRVIRRQFETVEGDPLNRRDIRVAEQKIRALGLFKQATVRVTPGSAPDRAIIEVDVEEERTGQISFGVGYSTETGLNGTIGLKEKNFLGRGQQISGDVTYAGKSQVLSFSFTEPALLDRDLLAGFDISYRRADRTESSFQETNLIFSPRVAFPVSENGRLQLRYKLSNDEIRDVKASASQLIKPSDLVTSSLELSYTHDARNSPIDPTAGYRLRIAGEYAGLGGDVKYTKATASAKAYTSLFSEDLVLSAEVEGGILDFMDGPSRITDRFFLGGDSFPGFARGGIGPRDAGDALGGNSYAIARLEATFPIGLPEEYGIHGGVFYDVGSVWALDDVNGTDGTVNDGRAFRSSAGVALFWATPLGPLRFNWAWPLEKEELDITERFRISIDTRF